MAENVVVSITYDDAGVQAAAKRIEAANQGIVASSGKVSASTTQVTETQRRLAPTATASADAFLRLQRSLDPVSAAHGRLEKAARDADAAIARSLATIADKERALSALHAKLLPATDGLTRFGSVADAVRGTLQGLAVGLGPLGLALERLGPAGLAAAAGIGAIIARSAEVTRHFDDLVDASQRAGVSVELLQALRQEFIANAGTLPDLNNALERLQQTLGDAAAGSTQAQEKLERAGVTSRDTGEAFLQAARHIEELNTGTQRASAAADLFGDRLGRGMVPALVASAGAQETLNRGLAEGTIATEKAANAYATAADKISLVNEQSKALGAEGLVIIAQAWANVASYIERAVGFAIRYLTLQTALGIAVAKNLGLVERQQQQASGGATGTWATPEEERDVLLFPGSFGGLGIKPPTVARPGIGGGPARTSRASGRRASASTRMEERLDFQRRQELDFASAFFGTGGEPMEIRQIPKSYEFKKWEAEGDAFYAKLEAYQKEEAKRNADRKKSWDAFKNALTGLEADLDPAVATMAKLGQIGNTAIEGISSGLADAVVEGRELNEVFSELAESLLKIVIQETIAASIRGALIGGFAAFAKGGTVQAGLPSGVYDRPTLFPMQTPGFHPMAQGMGLLGEAGPEAVLPLRRGPGGKLGVEGGGGRQSVVVNVINNAGARVTTREREGPGGRHEIDVLLEMVRNDIAGQIARPGTTLNRSLASASNPLAAR